MVPADAAPDSAAAPETSDDARLAPSPTTVILVRHAVTEETGPILSGRTRGIDLSDMGRDQAMAVADRLAGLPISAVYASPIERTTQTAQVIASRHGLAVEALDGMIEADYGEWTGQKLKDLAQTDLWKVVQIAPSSARFPGGESIREMQARAVATLESVIASHPEQIVAVVSHSDVIKAAVAHFAGLHLDLFQRIWISPASFTVLSFGPFGAALIKLNDTGTLDELRPDAQPGPEAPREPEAEATTAHA
jgi:probable phosphoglycerate mutase